MRARILEVHPADNFYSLRENFEGQIIDASQMTVWGDHSDPRLNGYYHGRAIFQDPPIQNMPSTVFLAVKLEEIPEGEAE